MNANQYAIRRGVNKALVSRWLRDGLLDGAFKRRGIRYEIEPEVADMLLEERLHESFRKKPSPPSTTPAGGSSPPDSPAPLAPPSAGEKPLTLNEARTQKECHLAALRQMELDEKTGRLIPKDQVEKEAFEVARQVRNAMLGIPSRVAAQLAAMSDEFQIILVLTTEIRNALQGVAE